MFKAIYLEESEAAGDRVVLSGRGVDETYWGCLAGRLASITTETDLAGALEATPRILAGGVHGRLLVDTRP